VLGNEPDIGRQKLIQTLQEEYSIVKEAAEETITVLAAVLEDMRKTDEEKAAEKIVQLEKSANNGDFNAQYELGLLLEKLERYKDSNYWFKKLAKHILDQQEKSGETNPQFNHCESGTELTQIPIMQQPSVVAQDVKGEAPPVLSPFNTQADNKNNVWVCKVCDQTNSESSSYCKECGTFRSTDTKFIPVNNMPINIRRNIYGFRR
jgi:hypothetical protein